MKAAGTRMTMAGLLLLMLAACDGYPRDQEGTLDRIEQTRQIRVGLTELNPHDMARARGFLARLGAREQATPVITEAPLEHQLALLETGRLDMVLGEFAEDSPWLADVAVIEPLTTGDTGERKTGLAPAVANGENAWVLRVEQAVRDDNAEANR